jgi:hypothetical protein
MINARGCIEKKKMSSILSLHRLERLYIIGLVAFTCTVRNIESYDNYNVVVIALFIVAICVGLSSATDTNEG